MQPTGAGVVAQTLPLQPHLLQRDGWTSLQLMHRTWLPQLVLLSACTPLADGFDELQRSRAVRSVT